MPAKTDPRVCHNCTRTARPGKVQCAECAAGESRRAALKYWGRVAAGVCTRCGIAPPRSGKRTCAPCYVYMQSVLMKRYYRLRAQGRCISCAKHRAWKTYNMCLKCYTKHRQRHRKESTP